MLADYQKIKSNQISYDVAIFGAGAAGIILSIELEKMGLKVALFESGGFSFDQHIQDLYKGEISAGFKHAPIDSYRLRYFGGSTNCWGGACVQYDDVDFATRPYFSISGWPIKYSDIEPFYNRASVYLGISSALFNTPKGEIISGIEKTGVFKTKYWKENKKTPRFLDVYKDFFKKESKVDLYLKSNLYSFDAPDKSGHINSVYLKKQGQRELCKVQSTFYVLCMGGLENARLLLNSPNIFSSASGLSVYGNVGKFYSPHINLTHGTFIPSGRVKILSEAEFLNDSVKARRFLSVTDNALDQFQLLNCKTTFERADAASADLSDEVYNYLNHRNEYFSDESVDRYNSSVDHVVPFKYASLLKLKRNHAFVLNTAFEQEPYRNSMVGLTNDIDELGIRKIKLTHAIKDEDIKRCLKYYSLLAKTVGGLGLGRLAYDDSGSAFVDQQMGASHHTGTSRMSDTPRDGVVDRNCKIHNLSNIYIAGASVFPTPSHANPTWTIAALAIRLADHLKQIKSS